jgi:hypothetical protein
MSIAGQDALYAVSLLRSIQVLDYLHLLKDKDLREFLAEQHKLYGGEMESLLFSDTVIKINRKEKQQSRAMLITSAAVYNFGFPLSSWFGTIFSHLKRRIPIAGTHARALTHVVICRGRSGSLFIQSSCRCFESLNCVQPNAPTHQPTNNHMCVQM